MCVSHVHSYPSFSLDPSLFLVREEVKPTPEVPKSVSIAVSCRRSRQEKSKSKRVSHRSAFHDLRPSLRRKKKQKRKKKHSGLAREWLTVVYMYSACILYSF